MDVDSPKVIPGTPSVDDYASLGDGDDLSRRTTPAFSELENDDQVVENGKDGLDSSRADGNGQQRTNGFKGDVLAAPYEMDLDNGDEEPLLPQALTAHRMVSEHARHFSGGNEGCESSCLIMVMTFAGTG